MKKGLIITGIILLVLAVAFAVYHFFFKKKKATDNTKPGVGFPATPEELKNLPAEYLANAKAVQALQKGYYIPLGSILHGESEIRVLEWMGELGSSPGWGLDILKKDGMQKFAEAAAYQASEQTKNSK